DIGEDLVCPLMGHCLRLSEGRHFRRVRVRLLIEEDPVGEDLVVGLNLGTDLFMSAEIVLSREDHRHQGEFRLVYRDVVSAADIDQSAIQIVEEASAVLSEDALTFVEDQVMRRRQYLILSKRTALQPSPQGLGTQRNERLFGGDEQAGEAE